MVFVLLPTNSSAANTKLWRISLHALKIGLSPYGNYNIFWSPFHSCLSRDQKASPRCTQTPVIARLDAFFLNNSKLDQIETSQLIIGQSHYPTQSRSTTPLIKFISQEFRPYFFCCFTWKAPDTRPLPITVYCAGNQTSWMGWFSQLHWRSFKEHMLLMLELWSLTNIY